MEPSIVPTTSTDPFPLNNLPYGSYTHTLHNPQTPQIGVAIGAYILSLAKLHTHYPNALPSNISPTVYISPVLNPLLKTGRSNWTQLRLCLKTILKEDSKYDLREFIEKGILVKREECEMWLPIDIGDYTDFYSSREHAEHIGEMFRGKDKRLMENWLWMPVGYHGRASSVIVSGTDIVRPMGQVKQGDEVTFGRSEKMDFEVEVASVIGECSALGERVDVDRALDKVFGLVLMNDWSARDIQKWEYVPLGPFNGKNFATTISPWVVTIDALRPFMVQGVMQENDKVLEYLKEKQRVTFDIELSVGMKAEGMNEGAVIGRMNFRGLYWTLAQQVAHHTISGCNLREGDLLASGTISGKDAGSYGSLIELAWSGTKPIKLGDSGFTRTFLEDGDEVFIKGECRGDGYTIGFGECSGRLVSSQKREQDI